MPCARLVRLVLFALFLAVGCAGAGAGGAAGADDATEARPTPAPEGWQCFAPEVTRRGGDAPRIYAPDGSEAPPVEADANGCAPADAVADTCCCNATEGPHFDGEQCCYRIVPCGCC